MTRLCSFTEVEYIPYGVVFILYVEPRPPSATSHEPADESARAFRIFCPIYLGTPRGAGAGAAARRAGAERNSKGHTHTKLKQRCVDEMSPLDAKQES